MVANYRQIVQITRVKQFRFWLPAAAWSALILVLSGDSGSSGTSGGLLRLIFPNLDQPTFDVLNVVCRKFVHVGAYGLAGFLNFRAVRGAREGWRPRWSVIAVVLAASLASIDEFRQTLTSTRSGAVSDVMLDTVAAIGAQFLAYKTRRIKN
jgi:VanZ family protein